MTSKSDDTASLGSLSRMMTPELTKSLVTETLNESKSEEMKR